MKSFPISHPQITKFMKYLMCIDGGNRSEATALLIAKDISKYLYWANEQNLQWETFLDVWCLHPPSQLVNYSRLLLSNSFPVWKKPTPGTTQHHAGRWHAPLPSHLAHSPLHDKLVTFPCAKQLEQQTHNYTDTQLTTLVTSCHPSLFSRHSLALAI